MAITQMISKSSFDPSNPNHKQVDNYPGHETGRVMHRTCCVSGTREDGTFGKLYSDCSHGSDPAYRFTKGPDCDDRCWVSEPLYMATSHQGLVLSLGEYNGYDDSDFYAVVWNPEKGCTDRITYASTRGWTYPNHAVVDATPEVVAAYEAHCKAVREEHARQQAEKAAKSPTKGKTVKVVRGRKVPKGTLGEVFWVGRDKFTGKPRLGLKDGAGNTHWVMADYCEVQGWESYL